MPDMTRFKYLALMRNDSLKVDSSLVEILNKEI